MGTNHIAVEICNSPDEAPNYNKDGRGVAAAEITTAVIVRNGTQKGKDTVDLVFKDKDGKVYVSMITGALLRQITDLITP